MANQFELVDRNGVAISASYTATATWTAVAAGIHANDVIEGAKAMSWVDKNGVLFPGGDLIILSATFLISETALQGGTEAGYSLKLYNVTPPSAHADNAVWDLPSGDREAFIDSLSLGTPVDVGASLFVATDGINKIITVAATGVTYAELVTAAAFTATATARKVVLHAMPV